MLAPEIDPINHSLWFCNLINHEFDIAICAVQSTARTWQMVKIAWLFLPFAMFVELALIERTKFFEVWLCCMTKNGTELPNSLSK